MTKAIRVENADTSNYKVVVQVWDKGKDLGDGNREPDSLFSETELINPTAMTETYIHSSRYLVVKEI